MHDGSVTGGTQAVTVQSGAHLEASSITVEQTLLVGVEVKDPGSKLGLSQSALRQFPSRHDSDDLVVRGAHAHCGGTLELLNTTISSVQFGVVANSNAAATLSNCTISNTCATCVSFSGGAKGKLTGCNILWSQTRHGLHVEGSGSFVEASRCKFVQHADSGIFAQNGGKVNANACRTSGSTVAGYTAQSNACIELTGCSSDADCRGCAVSRGGTLRASYVVMSDCGEEGVTVRKGGLGTLTGCSINRCGEQGVWAKDHGSVLTMNSCTVTEAQLSCIALMGGAHGRLQGCTLRKSMQRSGVVAENKGTKLYMEGCSLKGNAQCGMLANERAVVVVMGCKSVGNSGSSGFSSQSKAKVTVRDSSSEKEKSGVGVYDHGTLSAENVTVDGVITSGTIMSKRFGK